MDKQTGKTLKGAAFSHNTGVHTIERKGRAGRWCFVARRKELESLYNAVTDAATQDRLITFTITGDAGVGKSTLARELVSLLKNSGKAHSLFRIDLADSGGRPLLAHILQERFEMDTLDELEVAARLDHLALQLNGLLPPQKIDQAAELLATVMGIDTSEGNENDPDFATRDTRRASFRNRAIRTAFNLLAFDARQQPLILIVDGWDSAVRHTDIELTLQLIESMQQMPVCVIRISREEPRETLMLTGPDSARGLHLNPLKQVDMARLIESLLASVEDLPQSLVESIAEQAQGLPEKGEELVRLMIQRGVIVGQERESADDPVRWLYKAERFESHALPNDMMQMARERVESLSQENRRVLDAAAIVGESFWPDAVLSVIRADAPSMEQVINLVEDETRIQVDAAITSLEDAGFFEFPDSDPIEIHRRALQFSNPVIYQLALGDIDPKRAKRLNRLTGQWFARTTAIDRMAWIQRLAGYLEGGGDETGAATRYLEGGELAYNLSQLQKAIFFYRRGLSLVSPDTAELASNLLTNAATIYLEIGELEEAEKLLKDAVHYASVLDDELRVARSHLLLATTMRSRGKYERGQKHVRYAERLFVAIGYDRGIADALEESARIIHHQGASSAYDEARLELEKALKIRRALGDRRAIARTSTSLANIHFSRGDLRAAVRLYQEALSMREQENDRRGQLLTLLGLGAARYENGEADEALSLWERGLRLAEELGDRGTRAKLVLNIAEHRMEAGFRDDAYALCLDGLNTARETGIRRLEAYSLIMLGQVELKFGNQLKALEYLGAAQDVAETIDSRPILALALFNKARALSNALYDESAEAQGRQRESTDIFLESIQLFESMGELPNLIRALSAYGTFLVETGKMDEGQVIMDRAKQLEKQMRTSARAGATPDDTSTVRNRPVTSPTDTNALEEELAARLRNKKFVSKATGSD